jgi:chemotaxis signal transduction protein
VSESDDWLGLARSLREEFDRGFTERPSAARQEHLDFLAVRAAGQSYALTVGEIVSLYVDCPLHRLPSHANHALGLLGLVNLRGNLWPIYELGHMLGRGSVSALRWLVLVRFPLRIGFAFEHFDGLRRLTREEILTFPQTEAGLAASSGVRDGDVVRPIVSLLDLAESLQASTRRHTNQTRNPVA